jgi:protein phosphatase
MIFEWLESINNIIDSKGHSDPRYHDMGTTLVAFVYYGGEFYWMNCGDSRIYQFIGGKLTQISTDHSLSNLMGSTRHSNIITNCIGGGCKTSYLDMMKLADTVIQPGNTFMLCSDGLTDMLADQQIEKMLANGSDAEALCNAAVEAGGYDNVSVCVIRIEA